MANTPTTDQPQAQPEPAAPSLPVEGPAPQGEPTQAPPAEGAEAPTQPQPPTSETGEPAQSDEEKPLWEQEHLQPGASYQPPPGR